MSRSVKRLFGTATVVFILCTPAHATTITTMVGDKDNLGGAIAPGATLFPGSFDNRNAGELAATNGAQHTDYADGPFGTWLGNPEFVFDYLLDGDVIGATLTVGVGGIQSMNDRLYLDEMLLSSAFPDQGANGYDDSLSWSITGSLLDELLDNSATFRFNFNSNNTGEPVVFDYAMLTIETIPRSAKVNEPESIALLGLALLGLGLRRASRKRS